MRTNLKFAACLLMIGLIFGFLFGTYVGDCGSGPSHAYIEDANGDGVHDIKVVSKYGKVTFLYSTNKAEKFRLKKDIMKDFENYLETLKEKENQKYK